MKKNNTSIDIIAFGDLTDDNLDKLRALNEAVKSGDGSHLEIIPPGPNLLSDTIVASPILAGEGGGGGEGGGAANGDGGAGGESFEFGVDPNLDPELALVLRMSMEEERERQERERKAREEAEGRTNLESVAEESNADEGEPLLGAGGGEASGSGGATEEQGKKDDQDRMDTA